MLAMFDKFSLNKFFPNTLCSGLLSFTTVSWREANISNQRETSNIKEKQYHKQMYWKLLNSRLGLSNSAALVFLCAYNVVGYNQHSDLKFQYLKQSVWTVAGNETLDFCFVASFNTLGRDCSYESFPCLPYSTPDKSLQGMGAGNWFIVGYTSASWYEHSEESHLKTWKK